MNWPETELGPLKCKISINFTPNAECSPHGNVIFLKIGFKEFCCDRKREGSQTVRTGVRWKTKDTCIHRIRDGLSLFEDKCTLVVSQSAFIQCRQMALLLRQPRRAHAFIS